jgi:site-specific recombinase XerD
MDGQRFLIGPDGRPDERVNAFLASPRMRNRAENTSRAYAYSLGVWLNFLLAAGLNWWEASEDEAEAFQFWRLTDPRNGQPVEASSFARDVAACKSFYRWIGKRHAVVNPFEDFEPPRGRKGADVKWLDPAAVTRWIDVGLRGRDLSGRADPSWQGRNEQRDAAFAEGLYGTGLRLGSWASVVLPELPDLARGRRFFRCELADACAKGRNGYAYWTPLATLRGVLGYVEGARAAAVRRAQAADRYDKVGPVLLAEATRTAALLKAAHGGTRRKAWNDVGPNERMQLFRQTPQGLEPAALWLNEDGLPRDGHGWHHTFDIANERIASLGLDGFTCSPHMLRHSMALKWFAIGKLVHTARLAHLTPDEASDFRAQFGDTWHLVQTMLGHRRVETTKLVYLEPFQNLEVELLLAHADGFPAAQFMADAFAGHPRVRTDPLGSTG